MYGSRMNVVGAGRGMGMTGCDVDSVSAGMRIHDSASARAYLGNQGEAWVSIAAASTSTTVLQVTFVEDDFASSYTMCKQPMRT